MAVNSSTAQLILSHWNRGKTAKEIARLTQVPIRSVYNVIEVARKNNDVRAKRRYDERN